MNEVKDFAQLGVDEALCEALARQDINRPTAIQAEVLPSHHRVHFERQAFHHL